MFVKIFAFFAIIAVALAAPSPKAAPEPAPEPAPQYLTYSAGLPVYSSGVVPSVVSPYGAVHAPVAYSAYPSGPVFVR